MYDDLVAGRETEIRYLNGTIAEYGRSVGVPTPVNDALCALVREASEKRTTDPDTLPHWNPAQVRHATFATFVLALGSLSRSCLVRKNGVRPYPRASSTNVNIAPPNGSREGRASDMAVCCGGWSDCFATAVGGVNACLLNLQAHVKALRCTLSMLR